MTTKLTDEEKKERDRIRCKRYYEANKEKVLARVKAYQTANKEKINQRTRDRYQNDSESKDQRAEQRHASRRERYATDPEYKAKVIEAGKKFRDKHKTGYGRGRPKIGEERPISVLAERANRYRKDNEQWSEYNRKKQAEWAAANPERVKEIKRAYRDRKKAREQKQ
jgi:hypothetical protein